METESSKTVIIDGVLVRLSKVKIVENVGARKVYDLEVAGVHNYYASGMNVHNCHYHDMLKDYGNRYGEELLKFQTQSLHYPHRQLMLYPAGPNRKLLRGKTRWCISGDALVPTVHGLERLSHVQVGTDVVLAGQKFRVSNVFAQGEKPVYRVKTANGFSVDATADHKFMVSTGDTTDPEWRALSELKYGDEVFMSGSSGLADDRLRFRSIDGKRIHMSHQIAECLATDSEESRRLWYTPDQVPWVILRGSIEHAATYLKTLFSMDRSAAIAVRSLRGSTKFLQSVQQLLLVLGIHCTVTGTALKLGTRAHRALRWLLVRGRNFEVRQGLLSFKERVVSIVEQPPVPTYDLEIDDPLHAFVANGFVVHNCAAIDEWDFFDSDDGADTVRMNGLEVYKSLDNSMSTVRLGWKERVKSGFFNIPNAFFFSASSPQHARGVMYRHVQRNKDSRKILCLHLATWEVHPRMTRKELDPYFKANPVQAERDFGATPPLVDSAFIEDHESVTAMIGATPNRVEYKYTHKKSKGILHRAAELSKVRAPAIIEPSIMSIDGGYTNNSFSLTIGHRNPNPKDRQKVIIDVMAEIAPEVGVALINHNRLYEFFLKPLVQAFNVSFVTADRWNSIKMLQDMAEELGVGTEMYSLRMDDFTLLKNHIYDRTFRIPNTKTPLDKILDVGDDYPHCFKYNPVDHFLMQVCTVRDTGKIIDKGPNLTDDLWRAFALGSHYLLDDEWCKLNLKKRRRPSEPSGIAAGTMSNGHGVNSIDSHGVIAAFAGAPKKSSVASAVGQPGTVSKIIGYTS